MTSTRLNTLKLPTTIKSTLGALLIAGACGVADAAAPASIRDGAYYGTNYTAPFAHAYRALGALGVDRREAIDRDVYHMARLGLNAFRLHLWDVELADANGNIIEKDNEHLELLDYLIARLEERGIAIVLTAQTNFGNGYPERNTDPNGAYSYDYPKCEVHDTPAAVNAQANYLDALVRHVNPFTGLSYAADPSILAIEINNEPCHSGTEKEITAYVDRMASTLRDAGWKKEILYNVSHNLWRTQAFFDAEIDGTTYQWYPTGLVHGSARKGNFLPVLDRYSIPFDTVRGYDRPSRVIYEYDPADVLETYLYPAAARTFRKAGFTWITQFAYDPIDMARHNTEYQTHFLNLAYTPGKAIGMLIAAEATRHIPKGKDFGKYPADTVFDDFTVSARRNLAMFNDGVRYYHTNTTADAPKNIKKLRAIAGTGSSPLASTDGTGAYFLDALDKKADVWRLEVMPDVLLTADPFAKPSLKRNVAETTTRPVSLNLSGLLGPEMAWRPAAGGEIASSTDGTLAVAPGVYVVSRKAEALNAVRPDATFGERANMRVGEFVAPSQKPFRGVLTHTPSPRAQEGAPLTIDAVWVADNDPDSIVVYPANANFWNDKNDLFRMEKSGKYSYSVTLDATDAEKGKKDGSFRYRIVVFDCGGIAYTYPGGYEGTPLDWDFGAVQPEAENAVYTTELTPDGAAFALLSPARDMDSVEISTIPEAWQGITFSRTAPAGAIQALKLVKAASAPTDTVVFTKYVAPLIQARTAADMDARKTLRIRLGDNSADGRLKAGFVTADGFTYTATIPSEATGTVDIPLAALKLDDTLLTPAPYPSFLERRFTPDAASAVAFRPADIETLTLVLESKAGEEAAVEILGIEIE